MKNKGAFFMGLVWLLIAGILIFILVNNSNSKTFFKKAITSTDLVKIGQPLSDNKTIPSSNIKDLDIGMKPESVVIEKGTSSDIQIELYGNWNSDLPSYDVSNGTLTIKSTVPPVSFTSFNRTMKIILPKNLADNGKFSINAATVSGSVTINGLHIKNLNAASTSGSVRVQNVKADGLSIASVSGSVHAENIECAYPEISSTSGSVHAEGTFNGINASSTSGSVHVTSVKPLKENCTLSTISGSINLNIPSANDCEFSYHSVSGSYKNSITGNRGSKNGVDRNGSGKVKVTLSSTSGSIHVD